MLCDRAMAACMRVRYADSEGVGLAIAIWLVLQKEEEHITRAMQDPKSIIDSPRVDHCEH